MDEPRPPIVCDMSGAADTPRERLDEYARLFAAAFVDRERTPTGIRWRLRAYAGIEAWARDLAARENICCAFMQHTISIDTGSIDSGRDGGNVIWDATTVDDPDARLVLDLFYDLPVENRSRNPRS